MHEVSRRRLIKFGAAAIASAVDVMPHAQRLSIFLAGDVMLGRGIDQIMPKSVDPRLYEGYLTDARQYIDLVEGPVPRRVEPGYVWGEALEELKTPDVRIINLENAVTARGSPASFKGIHYRMHPENTAILAAAGIDCCVLANNHVLDWGVVGLEDTIERLNEVGIPFVGVGKDENTARAPAVISTSGGRVRVVALASETSGVPRSWQAGVRRPGVNALAGGDVDRAVESVRRSIGNDKPPGDIVVVSIHWGGNWGYEIPAWQRNVAHALIDAGLVDVVHGHSSHHPKGIEVYRDRLVLYGCGDLINDYEGIRGHEAFRSHLRVLYFPVLDATTGRLLELRLTPMRTSRFTLRRATLDDARWLLNMLNTEGEVLGSRFALDSRGRLVLANTDG